MRFIFRLISTLMARGEPDVAIRPAIIHLIGGDQQEVFAHIHGLTGLKRKSQQLTGKIARERNVSWTFGLSHKNRHAHESALPRAFHGHHGDIDRIFLPQQNMVGKINSVFSRKVEICDGNVKPFDLT